VINEVLCAQTVRLAEVRKSLQKSPSRTSHYEHSDSITLSMDTILSLFYTIRSLLQSPYVPPPWYRLNSFLVLALQKISQRILSCISGRSTRDHLRPIRLKLLQLSAPITHSEKDQVGSSSKCQTFIREASSSNLPRADRISWQSRD